MYRNIPCIALRWKKIISLHYWYLLTTDKVPFDKNIIIVLENALSDKMVTIPCKRIYVLIHILTYIPNSPTI